MSKKMVWTFNSISGCLRSMELHNQARGNAVSKLNVLNKETFLNKIVSIHYELLFLLLNNE